ncbi:MAG: Glyoxalase/bleomycin resistance protein/dioxygenase [Acidimicrobiales bacterium]|nr:Glyoxalase/bleomycin resistance protein/dioxygenase [Acidimicrobiales bacterium]
MRVTGFDHVVLVVSDVERSVAWYHDELGLEVERMEQWRAGEVLFPSLRLSPDSIIDVLAGERTGENVNHIAVIVEDADLDALAASGRFDVAGGPADLFGARGQGRGLYVRDPDANLVELRTYA